MDHWHEELGHFSHEGFQYPVPFRHIELMRTEADMPGPCCACKRRLGAITCGGCNAVKYCSQECEMYGWERRHGWEDHREIGNKIKKHRKETEDAIQARAEKFGGIDALLLTPLVIFGLFEYQCVAAEDFLGPAIANNQQEAYVLSRSRLTEAYAKCGAKASSCTAFRLAAENMLDLLCLCSNKTDIEHDRYAYCEWMVAAEMDQEALNYLCYFQHRLQSTISLPYLDVSKDEDIEGDSYLELLKDSKGPLDGSTEQWFHDYMLVALIKYKRLQYLLVQRQKDLAAWKTFLMGTHPTAEMASEIMKLRGNYPAIKKIQFYIMEEIDDRINQLNRQIEHILTTVNEQKPFIIPILIDVRSDPQQDELSDDNPSWAYINYGYAWNMSPSYKRVLQNFLDTGHVLSRSTFLKIEASPWRLESNPVEGFLQAAFDVDPTRWHGLWNSNHGHANSNHNNDTDSVARLVAGNACKMEQAVSSPQDELLHNTTDLYQRYSIYQRSWNSNHEHANSNHNNCMDWAARLVAGNACKMAVKEQAVSSPQDELLHNATDLYQRSTAGLDYEPTPGYSITTDYFSLAHQIPGARFEASERWYSLSTSRNSGVPDDSAEIDECVQRGPPTLGEVDNACREVHQPSGCRQCSRST